MAKKSLTPVPELLKRYHSTKEKIFRKKIKAELADDAKLLRDRIEREFNKTAKDMALQVMGFEPDSWRQNQYKLNSGHTNSAIMTAIKEVVQPMLAKWVKEHQLDVLKFNAATLKGINQQFQFHVQKFIEQYLDDTVEQEGLTIIKRLDLKTFEDEPDEQPDMKPDEE